MIDTNKRDGHGISGAKTRTHDRDTGMAMVLICLIVFLFINERIWVMVATGLLLVNMTLPILYRPLAHVWFGLSGLMGQVVSRVLLTVVFFVVVTPMGLIRKVMGKDSMRLREWKKDTQSVFVVRDHTYSPKDVEQPF